MKMKKGIMFLVAALMLVTCDNLAGDNPTGGGMQQDGGGNGGNNGGDNGGDNGGATTTYKDIAAVEAYLTAASGGEAANNPVPLRVELNLASGWAELLEAIKDVGKYVDLDLSACTMTGMSATLGEFDPGAYNTGESMIVSLVLPGAATSITAGRYGNPTFRYFTALKSVSGSGIDTVGGYAFNNCDALTTVSFLKATSIGGDAFYDCDALTTVDLPKAASIGDWAFYSCSDLTMVSLPSATSIGGYAFRGCSDLTAVSLPSATSIGKNAFSSCGVLTAVNLPSATSIGDNAFDFCRALTTVSLPEATSIGNYAFDFCEALTTVSFPKATSIGSYAFSDCTAVTTVSLPAATSIGECAFAHCEAATMISLPAATSIGMTAFYGCKTGTTITLGSRAPTLASYMFHFFGPTDGLTVTVEVPSGAEGYGTIPAEYSGNNTTAKWGDGFRGGGWTGSDIIDRNKIDTTITLIIEYQQ
jgi:hypothetical protein